MKVLRGLLQGLAPDHILNQGVIISNDASKRVQNLLEQRRLPHDGMEESDIRSLFALLSAMDSDKDRKAARIGEREARVSCNLVSESTFGFNHGVGRSGDILAPQPKAAGASCMYNLANRLALDSIRRFGSPAAKAAMILPLATGMSIGLALSACRGRNGKTEVVVARCDHASPMKAIATMGMKAKVVDGEVVGDAVRVSAERVKKAITKKTIAILSTTTFFPPRESDDIEAIAEVAATHNVPHIINNAYGVQSRSIMHTIDRASRQGRVDAFIQSTDKNFLAPVGGSLIASPDVEAVDKIGRSYAGRASATPILQFLASLLFLGVTGYERLRAEQLANRRFLEESMRVLANETGERLLAVNNPVAVAMTLSRMNPKEVGQRLYPLRVTGPRVLEAKDFGVCCPEYISAYITMNAALGSQVHDIELAIRRLRDVLHQVRQD